LSEFLNLLPPQEALKQFLGFINQSNKSEITSTSKALNRVTAEALKAPHSLPSFSKTTVDGYALRSINTHGASASLPTYLDVIGEVLMGINSEIEIEDGHSALIHTGGMMPKGADAAIMLEDTQITNEGELEILKAVAIGENVIQEGEDIQKRVEIIPAGKVIRAAEIGALMALGITELSVKLKPVIGIISSGDELISPEKNPNLGEIRDINSYTLKALAKQAGAVPLLYGIVPDNKESLSESLSKALLECQIVIVTAGSSASTRDHTAQVINELGNPGVLVHGINLRPGKPTILGICDETPIVGLPGNPVSAYIVANLFLRPIVEKIMGSNERSQNNSLKANLTINLSSQSGREDWVPIRIFERENVVFAEPIFGKSNLIFTLVGANALLRVAPEVTGLAAGTKVQVFPL
jgi:molybdopterin molybdotransferase